jgi:hypothetical protein
VHGGVGRRCCARVDSPRSSPAFPPARSRCCDVGGRAGCDTGTDVRASRGRKVYTRCAEGRPRRGLGTHAEHTGQAVGASGVRDVEQEAPASYPALPGVRETSYPSLSCLIPYCSSFL